MKTENKISLVVFWKIAFALIFATSQSAFAVNIVLNKGWPCNMFLEQMGVDDAVGNYADYRFKPTPGSALPLTYRFIAGEATEHLSITPSAYNSFVADLPFLEPLGFYFKSKTFGAKFGVDVCIPPVNLVRDDAIEWNVTVTGLSPLVPSAPENDWFFQSHPKVSMQFLATNCNGLSSDAMDSGTPTTLGLCEIISGPVPADGDLSLSNDVKFAFRLMASRQAVLRFIFEEQNTSTLRKHLLHAGVIQISLEDPPLPPLRYGDLLSKQLQFAPDPTWPECVNFSNQSGIAFTDMNIQGPNSSLGLRWTGGDVDCDKKSQTCADGNAATNGGFHSDLVVTLADGTIANPSTSINAEVKSFTALFNDAFASGENPVVLPSDGSLDFDAAVDQVYIERNNPNTNNRKTLFSATISRFVDGPSGPYVRQCRVWFKRDPAFPCEQLPDDQWLSPTDPNTPPLFQLRLKDFCFATSYWKNNNNNGP